jgi:hypothetical protein
LIETLKQIFSLKQISDYRELTTLLNSAKNLDELKAVWILFNENKTLTPKQREILEKRKDFLKTKLK